MNLSFSIGAVLIPFEFVLMAGILLGVALFHRHSLRIALIGLLTVVTYRVLSDPTFSLTRHFLGEVPFLTQFVHRDMRQGEWPVLLNLLGLLLGFAVLSRHFEESRIPAALPRFLPSDWRGPVILLAMIFCLSTFLDNIAAAMIGGAMASVIFKGRVHIGFLVAIVAASNAGGAGSVIGDTTTTMMWIDGVSAWRVLHAFIACSAAFLVFAFVAARQQIRYQPMAQFAGEGLTVDWARLWIVVTILGSAIAANVLLDFPAAGVWIAIVICGMFRSTPWREARAAVPGSVFLLSLVICASLMPVASLPAASWRSTFGMGLASAVFDNIPLTKLALEQGGYDWGFVAYAVGFGGSMIWFGSSAGVALSGKFPEAKSVGAWVKGGWHVILAYVIGFFALLAVCGWHP